MMNLLARKPMARTFRVVTQGGVWHVLRDEAFYGDFLSRGDAVRAACFGARTEEARGHTVQVIATPDGRPLPHHEPHFSA